MAPGPRARWQAGTRVGAYVLEARLGGGGMGEVWRARHTESGALHALKTLRVQDAALALRLQREAQAQARAGRHPHVVTVHSWEPGAAQPYLAMELATGGDLAARLRSGPLEQADAVALLHALAAGLAHVHAQGVLHRDLKPANVLFDEHGTPKLVDFGLASLQGAQSLTTTGQILGTPAYAAPEILDPARASPRSDVYGLGAILYHCLSGRAPYHGRGALEILHQLARGLPPKPLRSLNPQVSAALEGICAQAMDPAPDRRFPSAAAFAEALELWEREDPGRRRLAPSWIAAGLLLVALLGAASWWLRSPTHVDPAPPPATTPSPADPAPTTSPAPTAAAVERDVDEVPVEGLRALRYLADGRLLLLTTPRALRWAPGAPLHTLCAAPSEDAYMALALSANRRGFACVSRQGRVSLFEADDDQPRRQFVLGSQRVESAALSPGRAWLAVGTTDGQIAVTSPQGGAVAWLRPPRLDELKRKVDVLCFQDDDHLLAASEVVTSGPGGLSFWVRQGSSWVCEAQRRLDNEASAVTFTPDGLRVLVGEGTGVLRCYRLPQLEPTGNVTDPSPVRDEGWAPRAHAGQVCALRWRGDELFSLGGGYASRPLPSRLKRWSWRYELRETLLELPREARKVFRDMDVSPDGRRLALAEVHKSKTDQPAPDAPGRVRFLSLPPARVPRTAAQPGLLDAAFLPDQDVVGLSGDELRRYPSGLEGEPRATLHLPREYRRLAVSDTAVILIGPGGERLEVPLRQGGFGPPSEGQPVPPPGQALVTSRDGQLLALGSADGSLWVVDGDTTQCLRQASKQLERVSDVALLERPDQPLLLAAVGTWGTGADSGWVGVWERSQGSWRPLAHELRGGTTAVAFGSSGQTLLTGDQRGGISLLRLPQLEPLQVYADLGAERLEALPGLHSAHDSAVRTLAWRSDGVLFSLAGTYALGSTLLRWDACGQKVGQLKLPGVPGGPLLSPDGTWLLCWSKHQLQLRPTDVGWER